jgi:fluoroacetyl-CoA thioesterase
MSELIPGLKASVTMTVRDEDTALAMGSGNANVFSTPRMVGLMETAAVAALRGHLPEGSSSVGTELNIRHLAATPVGFEVTATAELMEVSGRRLTFRVSARDSVELVGEGTHVRAVIDAARFEQKARDKAQAPH